MGSLSKFFAEHLDLFTEAFDLDENSNLVEKDHTSVETVEKLVHEIFVHEMQDILTELVLPRRSSGDEEDDDGHGYRRMRLNPNAFTDAGWGPVAQHPQGQGQQGQTVAAGPQQQRGSTTATGAAPEGQPQTAAASMAGNTFGQKAPAVMQNLMRDFNLQPHQAAAILGNLGHESGGFTAHNQIGGGDGIGWAQWSGSRHNDYLNHAKQNNLDPKSDEANYGFLKHELSTKYSHAIQNLRKFDDPKQTGQAMQQFEKDYEQAGVKNYPSRENYANQALAAYNSNSQSGSSDFKRGAANYANHQNFGNPYEKGWAANNLTTVKTPSGANFQVHQNAAPAFQGFLTDLENNGYKVNSSGGYNLRNIRGSGNLSQHAYGNAIDVNAGQNPMGYGPMKTNMPSNVSDIAAKWGISWGGDWSNRKDPMHFEWTGKTPWLTAKDNPTTTPAAQQATQNSGGKPNYLAIGDSLAVGMGKNFGNQQYALGSQNPSQVNNLVQQAIKNGDVSGKHIVLSGGASNAAGDVNSVNTYYPQMINSLKQAGASNVTVMGVGPYQNFNKYGYNDAIGKITQNTGSNFTGPLDKIAPFKGAPNDVQAQVHPADYKPIVTHITNNFGGSPPTTQVAQAKPPTPAQTLPVPASPPAETPQVAQIKPPLPQVATSPVAATKSITPPQQAATSPPAISPPAEKSSTTTTPPPEKLASSALPQKRYGVRLLRS